MIPRPTAISNPMPVQTGPIDASTPVFQSARRTPPMSNT
jgi:hypothetical protein